MTANRSLKRRVRARAARTGESYTAALRHFRTTPTEAEMPKHLRMAIAQSPVCADPGNTDQLAATGEAVRGLMRTAHDQGARVVLFPEGALCSPHKRVMSSTGPDEVGPADWTRADWAALRTELTLTADLARELRLWTVVGRVHPLTPPHRPHNSLYVISDRGGVATRYDERMLSRTKVSHLYAPGTEPVTFTVDGVRLGCALGMEAHFPEVFREYERHDVDCVLFATTGEPDAAVFATEARGHAAANGFWVAFAVHAEHGAAAPSGLIGPDGRWLARCPADGTPAVVVADLDETAGTAGTAVSLARPWRRTARAGLYAEHRVDDPRSTDRGVL